MNRVITSGILLTAVLQSQAYSVGGAVVDRDGGPVEFAAVRISAMPDSVFVKGVTADADGRYEIEGVAAGEYMITASSMGYEPVDTMCRVADSDVVVGLVLRRSGLKLDELTVTKSRYERGLEGVNIWPSREQLRHSWAGYDLIRNLMLPGVSVDVSTGEVRAFGGKVSLYVDGMPADEQEVRRLRPREVERVQYMEAPSGRYAGDNVAINFVMKKMQSGGYVALDAMQRAGYGNGDCNVAAKVYGGNNQVTVFAGADYSVVNGDGETRREVILFPDGVIGRDYDTEDACSRKNSQYVQIRVRNKNERRTLRATLSYVRDVRPEAFMGSALRYSGAAGDTVTRSSVSSSRRGYKYSLGLSGSFSLPRGQFIEASASVTANRNHYGYGNQENGVGSVASSAGEDYHDVQGGVTWGRKFDGGNTLVFKAVEMLRVSSTHYVGAHESWQYLWSSETIVSGEYVQPLWGVAQLRVAPGVSAQSYSLRGYGRKSYSGPRAQVTVVVQPMRKHTVQLLAFYGNSYPQLATVTAATQQVDMNLLRRGNPDLKVSRMTRLMAVYGAGVGKVNLQMTGLFNGADRLPMSDYGFEDGWLVQSFRGDGIWRRYDVSVSAAWSPVEMLNAYVSGGYLYNGYAKAANVKGACWRGEVRMACFVGNVAVNVNVASPIKEVGYDRIVTRLPWSYGVSVSWSAGMWRVEAGADNFLSRRQKIRQELHTDEYRFDSTVYSAVGGRSGYVKVGWSVDFGSKRQREKANVDRSVDSGILRTM